VKLAGVLLCWVQLAFCAGCTQMSEQVEDPGAGPNGGFEITRSGLPVNWRVYSPRTIPEGSYELVLDRDDFREGAQSLCFRVKECSPTGGWHSPGITQELAADADTTYLVRFWIKSDGCDWTVSYGGVRAKTGVLETVDASEVEPGAWRLVERRVPVPAGHERLRFELSITSPGNLWIDDVRLEPVAG